MGEVIFEWKITLVLWDETLYDVDIDKDLANAHITDHVLDEASGP